MASPFAIFRKHQKLMIAGLAVMAMIAFTFFGIVPSGSSLGRGPQNPVVVTTTKFGNLRRSDIQSLRNQRQALLGFLRSVGPMIQRAGGDQRNVEAVIRIIGPSTEQAVVERWLLEKQAEQMGIAVNDKAINDFLTEIVSPLSQKDIEAVLSQQRSGLSEPQLLALLQKELLAWRVRQLAHQMDPGQMGLAIPPGQRWDYYLKLHREAKIEAVAVPIGRYLDKAPAPADAELKQFFEEHKETIPQADSPEPGFHIPQKVNMQYMKAERAKFMAAVSDAELRAEYDKSKKRWESEEKEHEDALRKAEAAEESAKTGTEKKAEPGEKSPASEKGKPSAQEKSKPTPKAEKPAPEKSGPGPKAEKPAPEKSGPGLKVETPAQEKAKPEATAAKPQAKRPAEEAAPEEPPEKPASPGKKPAERQGTGRRTLVPFRLVSFADEKPGDAAAKPQAEATAERVAPEEPPHRPAAEKPAAEKPAHEKPAAAKTPAKAPAAKTPQRPSEWLKDRIRGELADAKIALSFREIQGMMSQFHSRWMRYDADLNQNLEATPPTPLDFIALAKRFHLAYVRTGLVAAPELAQTDLGKSYMWAGGDESRNMPVAVARRAYESKTLFMPERSQDSEGNQYLLWKTQDEADRVPSWDDEGVQAEVLKAWKTVEARKLARHAAETLSNEAARAKRPLKEVFADRPELKILRPEPFTWLTTGHVPTESLAAGAWLMPRLSPVEGLSLPGTEFMRAVFDMGAGDVGAAMNQPQTVAYVIRATAFTPSEQELQKVFQEDDPFYQIRILALQDQARIDQAWKAEMEKAAAFQWAIKPTEQTAPSED
jgi:hypothetical protein